MRAGASVLLSVRSGRFHKSWNRPKNPKFLLIKTCIMGYTGLTSNFVKFQVLSRIRKGPTKKSCNRAIACRKLIHYTIDIRANTIQLETSFPALLLRIWPLMHTYPYASAIFSHFSFAGWFPRSALQKAAWCSSTSTLLSSPPSPSSRLGAGIEIQVKANEVKLRNTRCTIKLHITDTHNRQEMT